MRTIGILFIALVTFMMVKSAKAETPHNNAYCSGYAGKMAQVYRMKYYRDMQQYFEDKVSLSDVDELMAEYSQSGTEAVRVNVSISDNLQQKCENAYKRRL